LSSLQEKELELKLWYEEPAENFAESLPLGNGRLGAMVSGGIDEERIILNEISLWSGSPQNADRNGAHKVLPEIRRLLLDGRNIEAQDLVRRDFACQGPGSGSGASADLQFGCYQTLGSLQLKWKEPNGQPVNYTRELDISRAVARVTYDLDGASFERSAFVSAPDQIIVIRMKADKPGRLSFTATLDRPERSETAVCDNSDLTMVGQLNNGTDGKGMCYCVRLRVCAKGGTVTGHGNALRVDSADEVVLLIAAATDYVGFAGRNTSNPAKAALDDIEQGSGRSWEDLLSEHTKDFCAYFGRVSLDLGDGKKESAAAAELPVNRRLQALSRGGSDAALAALFVFCRLCLTYGQKDESKDCVRGMVLRWVLNGWTDV
jgi:alpha-L-fucosidase 2